MQSLCSFNANWSFPNKSRTLKPACMPGTFGISQEAHIWGHFSNAFTPIGTLAFHPMLRTIAKKDGFFSFGIFGAVLALHGLCPVGLRLANNRMTKKAFSCKAFVRVIYVALKLNDQLIALTIWQLSK